MNQKIICMFSILLLTTIMTIWTYPANYEDTGDEHSGEYNGKLDAETIRKVQMCESDLETMELCMRCAKITRSTIVYPLCCANEDESKTWCHAYVYYRRTNGTFSTD